MRGLLTYISILGGLVIFLVIIGTRGGNGGKNNDKRITYPESESQFMSAVYSAHQRASGANDLKKESIKEQRDSEICSALSNQQNASDWHGTVSDISSASDGAALGIKLPNGVVLTTWNNALSDFSDNTIISKSSSLYKSVFNLSIGDSIVFSGFFIKDGKSCAMEGSMTTNGSLNSPEFIFKFRDVRKYQQ